MRKIFFIAVILLSIGLVITACSGTDNKTKNDRGANENDERRNIHKT